MAKYVDKYFYDIWFHFRNTIGNIRSGGKAYYIVGNSTFYGVLLPVERIYQDMLEETGFTDTRVRIIRKRNSKKELYEYEISGKLP